MDTWPWIIVCVLFHSKLIFTSVHLSVVQKEIQLGKPLQLSCEIIQDAIIGSRKWLGGKGKGVLCLNGISTNPAKYNEVKVYFRKYLLNITEVSESDLNCPYACRFGFLTDERIISLNASNFKHLPVNSTTHVKYFEENGIYYLSIDFEKVFPIPSCTVKIRHRLSTRQNKLTAVSKETNGIFYHVRFSDVSTESYHSCDKPLKIECNIKDDKYSIRHEHNLSCSHSIPSVNESSESNLMVKELFPFLSAVICICSILVGAWFCCRKNHGPRKPETLELDEPLTTEPSTTPSTVKKKLNVDIAEDRTLSKRLHSGDMTVQILRIKTKEIEE